MVFNSIEFLLFFLPAFIILYALTPNKIKNVTLLLGSLVFYAFGELEYLILLMISVLVNYFFGLHLGRGGHGTAAGQRNIEGDEDKDQIKINKKSRLDKKRNKVLATAVIFNIGILMFFKFIRPGSLPLGISFYTFQIISYLTDVYRGDEDKETSFVKFASYITMFPQLLSGPIVYYSEVRTTLYEREYTIKNIQEGLKVFVIGLSAKVLLADRIALLWREAWVVGFESISTPMAWLAAIAYSMELYFDFCGYSLMAVGLGRMFGFELPKNFDNPYMASSVRDFYRRWHMTLGRWFRRYVYIPLGGNRKGEFRTVCNLLAVWFLTAVWHGITPNFLIWGMILWLAIVMERMLSKLKIFQFLSKTPLKHISHIYLWVLIPVTWMCFAITNVEQLQIYLGRMFDVVSSVNMNPEDWKNALMDYGWLLGVGAFACTPGVQKVFERFKDRMIGMLILAALFWICIWRMQAEELNPFMYLGF